MKEKWLMRVLSGMLVVAFLLAVASQMALPTVYAASLEPPAPGPQPEGCARGRDV